MNDARYPGFSPFQDNDHDRSIFFGRDTEKQDLLNLVLKENLVVVFGKSGLGKSSLINAGLMQELRTKGYLPFVVRFNTVAKDQARAQGRRRRRQAERPAMLSPLQAFYDAIEGEAILHVLDFKPGERGCLWEYFKSVEFWSSSDELLRPVIVLDQFEELFTLHGEAERMSFVRELADLVRNRPPQNLMGYDGEGSSPKYGSTPPDARLVIAIREDYLAWLDELSNEIPTILQNRFRVQPLTPECAKRAIVEPASIVGGSFGSEAFEYSPESLEAILGFLSLQGTGNRADSAGSVEPSQLQIICRDAERRVRDGLFDRRPDRTLTLRDLGGRDGLTTIFRRFFDEAVRGSSPPGRRTRTRKLCAKRLISPSGRRLSLDEEDMRKRSRLRRKVIDKLSEMRILRSEPRLGGLYFELSHDSLIGPIRASWRAHRRRVIALWMSLVLALGAWLGASICRDNRHESLINGVTVNLENGHFEEVSKKLRSIKGVTLDSTDEYIIDSAFFNAASTVKNINQQRKPGKRGQLPGIIAEPGMISEDPGSLTRAFKDYIEYDGGHKNSHIELGEFYLKLGSPLRAKREYEFVLNKDGTAESDYLNLANTIFLDYGDIPTAYEMEGRLASLFPDDTTIADNYTELCFVDRKFDEAIRRSRELLSSNKEGNEEASIAIRHILAASLCYSNRGAEADEELRKLDRALDAINGSIGSDWSFRGTTAFIRQNPTPRSVDQARLLSVIARIEKMANSTQEGS